MKRILITGASGFIGSFLVEEALRRGYETWASVRKNSSKKFLKDSRINFIELDLGNKNALKESLKDKQFDYVIHAAGITKAVKQLDFFKINSLGTQSFAQALADTQQQLKRFVFISSLSVMGNSREELPYKEFEDADRPQSNTNYGKSKLYAENFLKEVAERMESEGKHFPYIILRPTGVYGPREKDYKMMVDSIRRHVDFAVGFRPQDITFIYVSDLVDAAFLALERGNDGQKYFLSDGEVYQSATFSKYIRKTLGNPFCIRIVAPIWLLRIVTFCGDIIGRCTGRLSALNNDKFHILKQRNWRCNIQPAREQLGFNPKVKLEEGVRRMIEYNAKE